MKRQEAPAYSQTTHLDLTFPEKIELENGVILYWMKDVKDDSVKLEMSWRAGSKYQTKALSANFTNKMILSGSEDLSLKEIAEQIDFYGGYVQHEVDKDHAGLIMYGLDENMPKIFDVFTKAFSSASFPEDELKKELEIAASKFKVEMQKVKFIARREFNKSVFGEESLYGYLANEEDFGLLTRQDLLDFYRTFYSRSPVLFLTGNVSDSFIEKIRAWTKNFDADEKPKVNQEFVQVIGEDNVEKEDAVQVAFRLGRLMFKKDHQDYFNFQVLNTVLGGYFGSRLMSNLREEKGFTYGIGSGLAVLEDTGYFFITTELKKEAHVEAAKQIDFELERLREELIPIDELKKVKNYMLGEFLRQAEGPIAMMENYKNIFYHQLPQTYYADFMKAILKVTSEDLLHLAKKYLNKEDLIIIKVGT
jgi:zinc protease